jgi:hypothetical protein
LQDTIRLICRENGKESLLFVRLQYTPANHNFIQVALPSVNIHVFKPTYISSTLNTSYALHSTSKTAEYEQPSQQTNTRRPSRPHTRAPTRFDNRPIKRLLEPKRRPPNRRPVPRVREQLTTPRSIQPALEPNTHITAEETLGPVAAPRDVRARAAASRVRAERRRDLELGGAVVEARRDARVVLWRWDEERGPVGAGLDEAAGEDDGRRRRALRVVEVQELGALGGVAVAGEGVRDCRGGVG